MLFSPCRNNNHIVKQIYTQLSGLMLRSDQWSLNILLKWDHNQNLKLSVTLKITLVLKRK